nr:unnamed protein product [Callosobruchus analis]
MRLISGCLKSTPLPRLLVLSPIAPPTISRRESLVREHNKILLNPFLPIHGDLTDAGLQRLKSRSAPILLAENLVGENYDLDDEWRETLKPTQAAHIADPTVPLPGIELPRHQRKASTGSECPTASVVIHSIRGGWTRHQLATAESPARLSTT